jgi:hypothetical protein
LKGNIPKNIILHGGNSREGGEGGEGMGKDESTKLKFLISSGRTVQRVLTEGEGHGRGHSSDTGIEGAEFKKAGRTELAQGNRGQRSERKKHNTDKRR